MLKHFITLLIAFAMSTVAYAQYFSCPRFSAGFNLGGAALGTYAEDYPAAIGLTTGFELPVDESQFSVTATISFDAFVSKNGILSFSPDGPSTAFMSYIPIQFGGRCYFDRFFIDAAAGPSFNCGSSNLYTAETIAPQITGAFGYGFRFDKKGKYGLDIILRYSDRLESYNSTRRYADRGLIALCTTFSLGL